MEESRDGARRRTLKGGRITMPSGDTINGVIRNLSETGAALEIASPVGIPTKFSLAFDDGSAVRDCRLVWHKANKIGVAFE